MAASSIQDSGTDDIAPQGKLADHSISLIVLAAGRGRRMGGDRSKLLVPLADGEPVIRHAVRSALDLVPLEVLVITRPEGDGASVADALAAFAVRCIPNPRHDEGMGTSLALGVASLSPKADAVLVLLGDMPAVPRRIADALVSAYVREGRPITIPRYGQEVGPPTLFARSIFSDLQTLEGEVGGRQLVKRYPDLTYLVPFAEEERPPDIDTPRDLERLLGGQP